MYTVHTYVCIYVRICVLYVCMYVGGNLALGPHSEEVRGSIPRPGAFLWGVCMFCPSLCGFSPGALASNPQLGVMPAWIIGTVKLRWRKRTAVCLHV